MTILDDLDRRLARHPCRCGSTGCWSPAPCPEIHALHTTNGAWDLIAEIRAPSLADFDRVPREVRAIDGILNSETGLMPSSV